MNAAHAFVRAALLATFSLSPAACDPYVNATGSVRDPGGAPLESVSVTLTTTGRVPDVAKTSKDGAFNVGMVGADLRTTQISFQKPGYRTIERPIGSDPRPVLQITLVPETTSP